MECSIKGAKYGPLKWSKVLLKVEWTYHEQSSCDFICTFFIGEVTFANCDWLATKESAATFLECGLKCVRMITLGGMLVIVYSCHLLLLTCTLPHFCSPVSEDVTITRSKSEERLFADDNLEQWAEPDQFSLSANTAQLRTPSPLSNNTHSPSTPELEHWPKTNRQPTPPQVPPTPPGNTAYVSQSVASYRLRRFRKLSSEPV